MTTATKAIDHLQSLTDWRHARLFRDAAQIKRWREEDNRNGVQWESAR